MRGCQNGARRIRVLHLGLAVSQASAASRSNPAILGGALDAHGCPPGATQTPGIGDGEDADVYRFPLFVEAIAVL